MMPSHGVQRIPEGLFTEVPRSMEFSEVRYPRKRHKTTLKLVVRVWVRALDLASGGPVCSLVCLRAGCYMQPLGFLGGGTRFRGCMASRPRSYSTPTLWYCASVFSPSPFKREAPRPFFLPLFTEVPRSMEFSEVRIAPVLCTLNLPTCDAFAAIQCRASS